MPKLNTTIDNLEWKSNKVINAAPSADWTDTQYPSAKTLYNTYAKLVDIAHPVGSILTTDTNTNPASTVGGTWELVDKSLKATKIALTGSEFNPHLSSLGDNSFVLLSDHTISIFLYFTVSNTYIFNSSSLDLGKLVLSSIGLSSIPATYIKGIATTKGAVKTVEYWANLATDGSLFAQKSISGVTDTELPLYFYLQLVIPIGFSNMTTATGTDAFFDKFYWKRTA